MNVSMMESSYMGELLKNFQKRFGVEQGWCDRGLSG